MFCPSLLLAGLLITQTPDLGQNSTVLAISLARPVKLSIIPFVDRLGLEEKQGWPQDPQKALRIKTRLEEANKAFINRVGHQSRLGRITLIPQNAFPDYRIQITFGTISRDSLGWMFPVEARFYPQGEGKPGKVRLEQRVACKPMAEGEDGYRYWGLVLEKFGREFDASALVDKIFTSEF